MTRRYAIVLDFEATCLEGGAPDPQEIIEFPSVLVDLAESRVVDEFESFVRPAAHPALSPFCTELTSITQGQVDVAPVFPEVFVAHARWLTRHGLTPDNAVFVTCGDWDLARMLPAQLRAASVVDVPPLYASWCNLKVLYRARFGEGRFGMVQMLEGLGLTLEGHHHRGIDDCRNLARVLLALGVRDVAPTGAWKTKHWPPLPLRLRLGESVEAITLERRALDALKGEASSRFATRVGGFLREDGDALDADALLGLPAGTELTVVPRAC